MSARSMARVEAAPNFAAPSTLGALQQAWARRATRRGACERHRPDLVENQKEDPVRRFHPLTIRPLDAL
jgi:hypothetical protein